jgi:hypothetical protein
MFHVKRAYGRPAAWSWSHWPGAVAGMGAPPRAVTSGMASWATSASLLTSRTLSGISMGCGATGCQPAIEAEAC